MKLAQSQLALLIGFCLPLGIQLPTSLSNWDGNRVSLFTAGKQLANATLAKQGKHHD